MFLNLTKPRPFDNILKWHKSHNMSKNVKSLSASFITSANEVMFSHMSSCWLVGWSAGLYKQKSGSSRLKYVSGLGLIELKGTVGPGEGIRSADCHSSFQSLTGCCIFHIIANLSHCRTSSGIFILCLWTKHFCPPVKQSELCFSALRRPSICSWVDVLSYIPPPQQTNL